MDYSELTSVYEKLASTTKRLEKTFYIAELLKKTSIENADKITLLLQGKVFPNYDPRKIGVAAKTIIKAIKRATGRSETRINDEWKNTGDLGETTFNLVQKSKSQTLASWGAGKKQSLTVERVFESLQRLAVIEGQGTIDQKISLLVDLMKDAKPIETKYIVKTVLEELRLGVAEGILRDAIVWSNMPPIQNLFVYCRDCDTYQPQKKDCILCNGKTESINDADKEIKDLSKEGTSLREYNAIKAEDEKQAREIYDTAVSLVQDALDISNDYGKVASVLKEKGFKGLQEIELVPLIPIKVMLALKSKNIDEAFERVGSPCYIEYKYDGFRMQIHKKDDKIKIFTRRLEDVTEQFPDAVKFASEYIEGDSFIIEGEAVGYDAKTKKYLPFQNISQRIKRKYDIQEISKGFPIEVNAFEILYHDGKSMLKEPFNKRREVLDRIIKSKDKKIVSAKAIKTDDKSEAHGFYDTALKEGHEGVMLKRVDGRYKPGLRVGEWVKLKPVMESLDLVITAAEWGEGKRSSWITSYYVSCQDKKGELKQIGKVSTGLKELEGTGLSYQQMTELLKPLTINEDGRSIKVKPQVVIEVDYEEIQKSPTYSSGYALRFPRVIRLRDDKGIEDISTLEFVKELYEGQ